MFNIVIGILVEKHILTEKEGTELSEKLGTAMLPSDYRESQRMLKKLFAKLK